MDVLNQELTDNQYIALNRLAQNIPDWNAKSNNYKIGVIMGIKARID